MAHGQTNIKEEEAVNNVSGEIFLEKETKKGIERNNKIIIRKLLSQKIVILILEG